MLGSPNPGYFTYDGDQSAKPNPTRGVPRVPEGSAGIERTLVAYLKGAGKPAEDTSFDGRSDYDGFTKAGVPAGGLFSGAEEKKIRRAGRAVGRARRTSRSIRTTTSQPTRSTTSTATALEINGGGVAYAVGSTRRIRAAATACRSATTAPDTCSNHEGHGRGHGHCGRRGADVVLVHRHRAPAPDLARDLAGKVTADGMYTHLRKLQEIADANRGNRAEGTPGYDASVDYVAKVLQDKGFDVQTPEFERLERTRGRQPDADRRPAAAIHVDQASLLVATPPGGLNAITLRPQKAAGLHRRRLRHDSVKGAIAVVDDTGCSVGRQAERRGRQGRRRVARRQRARAPTAARRVCSRRATTSSSRFRSG